MRWFHDWQVRRRIAHHRCEDCGRRAPIVGASICAKCLTKFLQGSKGGKR
jgi:ribosomal protein L37E